MRTTLLVFGMVLSGGEQIRWATTNESELSWTLRLTNTTTQKERMARFRQTGDLELDDLTCHLHISGVTSKTGQSVSGASADCAVGRGGTKAKAYFAAQTCMWTSDTVKQDGGVQGTLALEREDPVTKKVEATEYEVRVACDPMLRAR